MNLLADNPIVAAREHPVELDSLKSLRRRGKAWSPLPGIFARYDVQDCWETRVRAAHLWAPDHVLAGAAAARLLWWPDLASDEVELWGSRRTSPATWLQVGRWTAPPELICWWDEMKVLAPQASALQLAKEMGGKPIDEVLRRKAATLGELNEVLSLMPGKAGNTELRRLLWESRDRPWSELEREAHRRLRAAGVKGWKTNIRIQCRGDSAVVDIVFPGAKLVVEMDGYEFHSGKKAFDNDRRRQNLLVLSGWTVLRFTWATIDDLIPQVRAALGL